jgi:hypothetical protein
MVCKTLTESEEAMVCFPLHPSPHSPPPYTHMYYDCFLFLKEIF